jgi:membrane protease YdiL (CAAX protease family)
MIPLDHPTSTETMSERIRLRNVPWRWRDIVIGIAPLVLARVSGLVIERTQLSASVPSWMFVPVASVLMAWMIVYPLSVARKYISLPSPPRGYRVLLEAFIALLVVPVIIVVASVVVNVLFHFSRVQPHAPFEAVGRSAIGFNTIALLIIGIAVAPVAEEILFRGMIYNALRQRFNILSAALAQGIVFGLLHPFDLINAVGIAVIGTVFALMYEWRKLLLAPMFVHGFQNAIGLGLLVMAAASYAASPMLGVVGDPHKDGCIIIAIAPASAAERAGLQVGDVITAIDDGPVFNTSDIIQVMRSKKAGDRVTVRYIRSGEAHQVEAILTRRSQ